MHPRDMAQKGEAVVAWGQIIVALMAARGLDIATAAAIVR